MKSFNLFLTLMWLLAAAACKQQGEAAAGRAEYYTCSMHPSVRLKDPKAKCPICGMALIPVQEKGTTNQAGSGGGDVYTCSMHPSVRLKDPKAKCPLCGMSLIPAAKGAGSTNASNSPENHEEAHQKGELAEFEVPPSRQQLIGVTYTEARKLPLKRTIRATGVVAYDRQRHWDFVSRVDGYVQKLEVGSRGDVVEKGQPLLTIYSPELLTTQREFVDLLSLKDEASRANSPVALESAERLIEAGRRRLSLWNISSNQIAELERTRQPQQVLTLYSPFRGVVQDIPVDQGRRVSMGDHLVDVADLSTIWIWANLYQEELSAIQKGVVASIRGQGLETGPIEGKVDLVDPFLNETTRTGRVRITAPNPALKLRPDMYVEVLFELDQGEGVCVPVSAVLPTGKHDIVFVDKSAGKLEPRFVELAGKFGTNYAIKTGLRAGDRVVSSANFLIDAEAKIQGALKDW